MTPNGQDAKGTTHDAAAVAVAPPARPTPIAAQERIEVVDVLRGFAVFGILLVNMAWFSNPIYAMLSGDWRWTGGPDKIAEWVIRFLAESKFYSLFSFLFGFGMTVQMFRAETRGTSFGPTYARRLLVLLAIGLAHGILLWSGDILIAYSVLGFILLLFRKRSAKTLIIWALICLVFVVLITGGLVGLVTLGRADPHAALEVDRGIKEAVASYEAAAKQAYDTYARGSFREILIQRIGDLGFGYIIIPFFIAPSIFGMFLFGVYAGRRGVLHDSSTQLGFIRKVAVWGLVMGVPASLVLTIAAEWSTHAVPTPTELLAVAVSAVGAPALCFFYAATILLLWQRESWRKRLRVLAPVGRMALTNYLLQSLICTTIFNAYGLGLYGKVGPAVGLGLTVAIYALQIPLSHWWLRRFRFGPVEWLWRSLTYARRQEFRGHHT